MPTLRVGAHYDLYRDDPTSGQRILVSTSRACHVCGQPLTGPVVPAGGDRQVHVTCAKES
jgi:hypothetical protein